MKVVFLGATKGMGRALARRMAPEHDVFLLGRDLRELARSASDLEVRAGEGRRVGHAHCDLAEPEGFSPALDAADDALGGFDTVVVTAGLFASQDRLESDAELTRRVLTVNYVGTIGFCEEVRKRLLARGGGTLCAFSSVAGERGRKPVVLYGSSKAGLSAYLEGLDHRYREEGLRTICVKPGFVRTGMTQGLDGPPLFLTGTPKGVAGRVMRAIERGSPVVYAPAAWAPVMAVIRALPRFVMRKISF
jgi:short-subunit dehydrogenase